MLMVNLLYVTFAYANMVAFSVQLRGAELKLVVYGHHNDAGKYSQSLNAGIKCSYITFLEIYNYFCHRSKINFIN